VVTLSKRNEAHNKFIFNLFSNFFHKVGFVLGQVLHNLWRICTADIFRHIFHIVLFPYYKATDNAIVSVLTVSLNNHPKKLTYRTSDTDVYGIALDL
jgi:hypothetical protein